MSPFPPTAVIHIPLYLKNIWIGERETDSFVIDSSNRMYDQKRIACNLCNQRKRAQLSWGFQSSSSVYTSRSSLNANQQQQSDVLRDYSLVQWLIFFANKQFSECVFELSRTLPDEARRIGKQASAKVAVGTAFVGFSLRQVQSIHSSDAGFVWNLGQIVWSAHPIHTRPAYPSVPA